MAKKKLELSTKTVEDVTFLRLKGVIDEDNPFVSALKRLSGRTVVIDLADVRRINSCGVRDWVNWLTDLQAANKQVILVRCSPLIVNQLNMVNNFVGHATVKSFFAPYYCERCDTEQLKLLQVDDFAGQSNPKPPKVTGRSCADGHCQMVFDDIEEAYFSFLPRSGGAVVDARMGAILGTLSPSIQDRIKRLDSVEEGSADRNTSSVYNPLTVTSTGISIARDSINVTGPMPAPPEVKRNRQSMLLMGVAVLLAAGVAAYVLFSGR